MSMNGRSVVLSSLSNASLAQGMLESLFDAPCTLQQDSAIEFFGTSLVPEPDVHHCISLKGSRHNLSHCPTRGPNVLVGCWGLWECRLPKPRGGTGAQQHPCGHHPFDRASSLLWSKGPHSRGSHRWGLVWKKLLCERCPWGWSRVSVTHTGTVCFMPECASFCPPPSHSLRAEGHQTSTSLRHPWKLKPDGWCCVGLPVAGTP